MAVSPVTSTNAVPTSSNGSSIEEITNNFMNLLVAQMQNQDPTNPMDNNQLTSLMAQFNTAAGVQQLNGTVGRVNDMVISMQQMNAAQWVGRTIYIEGESKVTSAKDGFAFSVSNDVDKVSVVLTDKAGNSYTADLKDVDAGMHKLTFEDLSGFQPAEPSFDNGETYKVTFTAVNQDGSAPAIASLKSAKVEGVSFGMASGAVLQLGLDGTTTLNKIYSIE